MLWPAEAELWPSVPVSGCTKFLETSAAEHPKSQTLNLEAEESMEHSVSVDDDVVIVDDEQKPKRKRKQHSDLR